MSHLKECLCLGWGLVTSERPTMCSKVGTLAYTVSLGLETEFIHVDSQLINHASVMKSTITEALVSFSD